jgi:hypothetical protein
MVSVHCHFAFAMLADVQYLLNSSTAAFRSVKYSSRSFTCSESNASIELDGPDLVGTRTINISCGDQTWVSCPFKAIAGTLGALTAWSFLEASFNGGLCKVLSREGRGKRC